MILLLKVVGIVKSMYGNKYYSAIPAICEGGILVSDSQRKADLFNEYFVTEASIPFIDSTKLPSLTSCSLHTLALFYYS